MNIDSSCLTDKQQACIDDFCYNYNNEPAQFQIPQWKKFWSEQCWESVRHIISKNPYFEEYCQYSGRWTIIGSCNCNNEKGDHPHKHYIVIQHKQLDAKTTQAHNDIQKFYYNKGFKRNQIRSIAKEITPHKMTDNVIQPNCFHHAINMLLYVHKPSGVRKNKEHIHTNGSSIYLPDNTQFCEELRIRLQAQAFKASKEELFHVYPPFMFDRELMCIDNNDKTMPVECPCASTTNRFCKNKIQTSKWFLKTAEKRGNKRPTEAIKAFPRPGFTREQILNGEQYVTMDWLMKTELKEEDWPII